MGKTKSPEIAYMIMRNMIHPTDGELDTKVCVAVCEYLEDADEMAAKYTQQMHDRGIETINFYVTAVPFYD